jgi:phosphate transport system substrate-binding protein
MKGLLQRNRKRHALAAVAGLLVAISAVAAVGVSGAQARSTRSSAGELSGAGATFPAPLIAVWQQRYQQQKGVKVNYNAIGSGGGIAAITNKTVDFGASDAPLTPDQFNACGGCVQIPWVLSATSVMYNMPGVAMQLKITGPVLADIYLGKITNWNDARLQRLNKGEKLPDRKITPVYRSDSSGTTFNFTSYLNTASKAWKSRVGNGTNVNWPAGVGARGSSGVSGVISRTPGAIGYADVAYALNNHLAFFKIQNRSGRFALPGLRGIRAASLADRKFSSTNALSIVNPPKGRKFLNAYPICTYSYVLLRLQSPKAALLKPFVTWAVTQGQSYGPDLRFQPVPPYVVARAKATLKKIHA